MDTASGHVVIVGGGASGTLLATTILRERPDLRVTLIEKRGEVGRGFAYGEAQPFHLLNVRASNLSAYAGEPRHFVDWLDRNGVEENVTGSGTFRFAPRAVYGRYLSEQLKEATAAAPGRFTLARGSATTLERESGSVCVHLEDGQPITADAAVIATGYEPPRFSSIARGHTAWSGFSGRQLEEVETALIIGTGHTAVDHIQWLIAAGFEGRIIAISRHGWLPLVHKPVEPLGIDPADVPFGARVSRLLRWFRARDTAAAAHEIDWRAVIDGMRPHAQSLWQTLPVAEQRRFIRHVRAWYDVRRHRMAPSIADALDGLIAVGRIEIIAGKIESIASPAPGAPSVAVTYRRRGQRVRTELDVEMIIDCTGFSLDVRRSTNQLIRSLIAQGLARPNRHALGFDVDASCRLIDSDGTAAGNMYAIGPLTRGQFWEATGIPDIRKQCADLANAIAR